MQYGSRQIYYSDRIAKFVFLKIQTESVGWHGSRRTSLSKIHILTDGKDEIETDTQNEESFEPVFYDEPLTSESQDQEPKRNDD